MIVITNKRKVMRQTKQRKVILDVLSRHKDHPGADTLYEEVRKILPKISLGTVYRNLEMLSQSGVILKIENGAQKRFDPMPVPHPHFRCLKCGAIEDLPFVIDDVIASDKLVEWAGGRKIQSMNLEYTGLCAKCNGSE